LRLLWPKFASFVAILRKSVRSKRTTSRRTSFRIRRPGRIRETRNEKRERSFPEFANLDIGININH
jgi:hypothetical protein